MNTEKPAPRGASSSWKSIEARHPEATARDITDQARSENDSDRVIPFSADDGCPTKQSKEAIKLRFFVHPALDDLGLKPIPFRVYSHLLRRAGKNGVCNTGADRISEVCRMNRKTVFKVIAELEEMGLIKRSKEFGGCNRYRVPWPPPIVPSHGTIDEALTGHQSSHPRGRKVTSIKENDLKEKRAFSAVTDSASAECATRPHPTDAGIGGIPSLAAARKMALEIREKESKADPYGNFALFSEEDYVRWAGDWHSKIEQNGSPRNPEAALYGYLRKATNRSSRKFRELHDADSSTEEPPF